MLGSLNLIDSFIALTSEIERIGGSSKSVSSVVCGVIEKSSTAPSMEDCAYRSDGDVVIAELMGESLYEALRLLFLLTLPCEDSAKGLYASNEIELGSSVVCLGKDVGFERGATTLLKGNPTGGIELAECCEFHEVGDVKAEFVVGDARERLEIVRSSGFLLDLPSQFNFKL